MSKLDQLCAMIRRREEIRVPRPAGIPVELHVAGAGKYAEASHQLHATEERDMPERAEVQPRVLSRTYRDCRHGYGYQPPSRVRPPRDDGLRYIEDLVGRTFDRKLGVWVRAA
jgi:hypothetical protein